MIYMRKSTEVPLFYFKIYKVYNQLEQHLGEFL